MSRAWAIVAIIGAALLAAGAAFVWWTASPADNEASLASALSLAPPADGRLAIAQPWRAARWLLRHPQALGLLAVAAPAARSSLPRLQPMLRPLVDGAQGPLVVWWQGRELAVATRLRPGAIRAMSLLAARRGLAYDVDGDIARIATAATLLGRREAPTPSGGQARVAALADVGGRRWRLVAGRDRLVAAMGAEVDLAEEPGLSRVETTDASPFLRSLEVPVEAAPLPVRAVFGAGSGWGVAVSGAKLPRFVRDAVRAPEQTPGDSAHRWNGLIGEVWVRGDEERLLVATSEVLLSQVEKPPLAEQGRVTGADLAWLANDLAAALARLPLLDREARALRAAGVQAAGLGVARWRATSTGARIELEW